MYQAKNIPPFSSILFVPLTNPTRLILHIYHIYSYHKWPLTTLPPSSLQYDWLLCTYQTNNILYVSLLGMNRKRNSGQRSAPEATIHLYRWDDTMAAPLQSYCDDTMHVGGVLHFFVISRCPVFDVALWPNHDRGNKSPHRFVFWISWR